MNVLVNLLQYEPRRLFHKVMGNSEFMPGFEALGDVLSHINQTTDLDFQNGKPIRINLMNNPSHLEAINPVALGKTRAKIAEGKNACCLLIHGDASFTGQGVVSEILSLSGLPNFSTSTFYLLCI